MRLLLVPLVCIVQFASSRSVNFTSSDDDRTMTTLNPVATTELIATRNLTRYEKGLEDYDEAIAVQSRGMSDYDYHDVRRQKIKEVEEQKAVKTDPWAGYYDFIINEGSFKFWAAFQLGTALLLAYSAFAAVYYAKFNPITSDYDYYDDFFFRSNGRSAVASSPNASWPDAQTFQQILSAITSKKYS